MSALQDTAPASPAPLSRGLPEGSILADKYRIDALLAEGGMGLVYLGWHLILDQAVAIKLVRPELATRPDAAERFLNEARAVARLRGPNVARVLDSGRAESGQLYMVFEYLQGADLRTVLDTEGPLGIERSVDYVLQASEAMAEAHVAGIVHRDLKPENLFLTTLPDGTDQIKVLDFGISKRLDDHQRFQTVQGQNLGSPHYMAPEQMATPSQVDTRADLWSLGIVLYELLSGDVPFDGETVPTICAQVLGREPAPIRSVCPDVPAGLEAVIARCLEKRPERRYQTVSEFADALVPYGSAAAEASKRRIRRLFGLERASAPEIIAPQHVAEIPAPVNLDVEVDLSGFEEDEQTPSPRTISILHPRVRPARRILWPVAIALAAGITLAVGLPEGAFVSDAMAHARARFSAALASRGEQAKAIPELQSARPALSPLTTATAIATVGPALPADSSAPSTEAASTAVEASVLDVAPAEPTAAAPTAAPTTVRRAAAPRAWTPPRRGARGYRAPARPAPVPAAPQVPAEAPTAPEAAPEPAPPAGTTRPRTELMPPYGSKTPAPSSDDFSFRSAPSTQSLMVSRERGLDDGASSRVDSH